MATRRLCSSRSNGCLFRPRLRRRLVSLLGLLILTGTACSHTPIPAAPKPLSPLEDFERQHPQARILQSLETDLNKDGQPEWVVGSQEPGADSASVDMLLSDGSRLPVQYVAWAENLQPFKVLDHGDVAHLAIVVGQETRHYEFDLWAFNGKSVENLLSMSGDDGFVIEGGVLAFARRDYGVEGYTSRVSLLRWDPQTMEYIDIEPVGEVEPPATVPPPAEPAAWDQWRRERVKVLSSWLGQERAGQWDDVRIEKDTEFRVAFSALGTFISPPVYRWWVDGPFDRPPGATEPPIHQWIQWHTDDGEYRVQLLEPFDVGHHEAHNVVYRDTGATAFLLTSWPDQPDTRFLWVWRLSPDKTEWRPATGILGDIPQNDVPGLELIPTDERNVLLTAGGGVTVRNLADSNRHPEITLDRAFIDLCSTPKPGIGSWCGHYIWQDDQLMPYKARGAGRADSHVVQYPGPGG